MAWVTTGTPPHSRGRWPSTRPGYAVQAVKFLVAPAEPTRGDDAAGPGWGTGVTAVEG
ncbi:hypothetical protein L3055_00940 [Corynebacterium sp. MC-02]|uniref:hypothetical protein n=1 Tax=Corynebacterium pseudokroppenstedtii TaxID=2804917 RepID=UPI001F2A100B|nr:hypothetical protein [Corynebacterium pseudokroppenstedtii]MCF8702130.1 hypothetical protein [Corynebacterium pseudokroppenstedtii]